MDPCRVELFTRAFPSGMKSLSKYVPGFLQLITFVSEQRSKYTVYPPGELLISTIICVLIMLPSNQNLSHRNLCVCHMTTDQGHVGIYAAKLQSIGHGCNLKFESRFSK